METTIEQNTEQSRYELRDGDVVAGFVEYRDKAEYVELTHTEVDPSYKGQGLASRLASAVLDHLQHEERAVVPSCEFINGYLQKHPEYVDLVPADRRAEFGL